MSARIRAIRPGRREGAARGVASSLSGPIRGVPSADAATPGRSEKLPPPLLLGPASAPAPAGYPPIAGPAPALASATAVPSPSDGSASCVAAAR